MRVRSIRRGDIVIANLPTTGGSIQHGRRLILIVSNNICNTHSPVVTYVPITKVQTKASIPTHVKIARTQYNHLKFDSIILCEQIMSIDKKNIIEFKGRCDSDTMRKVDKALAIQLGLRCSGDTE